MAQHICGEYPYGSISQLVVHVDQGELCSCGCVPSIVFGSDLVAALSPVVVGQSNLCKLYS